MSSPGLTVLLLNPPARRPVMRDYFCSKVAKAGYYYHPVDLLFLAGIVGQEHRVEVLDAVALGWSRTRLLRRAREMGPDVVISLVGGASWTEDLCLLGELAVRTGARMAVIGDLALEQRAGLLSAHPWLDAVLLDFTTPDVLAWLRQEAPAANVAWRDREGEVRGGTVRRGRGVFRVPLPRHDLLPLARYRFVLARRHPFGTLLTDFGCDYHCHYCPSGFLGHKVRPLEEVGEELDLLHRLGVRELFVRNQTLGAPRDHTEALCALLGRHRGRFGWIGFARVDTVDAPLLREMARSGCHTLMFGVESAGEEVLARAGKRQSAEKARSAIEAARRQGIRTLGTFVLGLPGEDLPAVERTAALARELPLDLATFNVATPRMGTALRRQALHRGWVRGDEPVLDSSTSFPVMETPHLSREALWRARRRAVRRFYLRPRLLLRRVQGARGAGELRNLLLAGVAMVRGAGER